MAASSISPTTVSLTDLLERTPRSLNQSQQRLVDGLEHLRGRDIVTLDLDSTLYCPISCECWDTNRGGQLASSYDADGNVICTHLIEENLNEARAIAAERNAVLVVLSWRRGYVAESKKWATEAGFHDEIDAWFIPGGDDDISRLPISLDVRPWKIGAGQSMFKGQTMIALAEFFDARVIASFDDARTVRDVANSLGVEYVSEFEFQIPTDEYDARKKICVRFPTATSTRSSAGTRRSPSYGEQMGLLDDFDSIVDPLRDDDEFAFDSDAPLELSRADICATDRWLDNWRHIGRAVWLVTRTSGTRRFQHAYRDSAEARRAVEWYLGDSSVTVCRAFVADFTDHETAVRAMLDVTFYAQCEPVAVEYRKDGRIKVRAARAVDDLIDDWTLLN